MNPQHEEPVPAGDASGALDALGDANRRAIVQILSAGGRSVQEIADNDESNEGAVCASATDTFVNVTLPLFVTKNVYGTC